MLPISTPSLPAPPCFSTNLTSRTLPPLRLGRQLCTRPAPSLHSYLLFTSPLILLSASHFHASCHHPPKCHPSLRSPPSSSLPISDPTHPMLCLAYPFLLTPLLVSPAATISDSVNPLSRSPPKGALLPSRTASMPASQVVCCPDMSAQLVWAPLVPPRPHRATTPSYRSRSRVTPPHPSTCRCVRARAALGSTPSSHPLPSPPERRRWRATRCWLSCRQCAAAR